ncbi:MAG: hypothetical protein ACR2NU_13405, partial [Aeoliella sp.]
MENRTSRPNSRFTRTSGSKGTSRERVGDEREIDAWGEFASAPPLDHLRLAPDLHGGFAFEWNFLLLTCRSSGVVINIEVCRKFRRRGNVYVISEGPEE